MYKQQPQRKSNNNQDLARYAGLGMQMLVSLGIAVFAGYKLDGWINLSFPIFIWSLPLLVLIIIFYKLIKETDQRNKTDNEK